MQARDSQERATARTIAEPRSAKVWIVGLTIVLGGTISFVLSGDLAARQRELTAKDFKLDAGNRINAIERELEVEISIVDSVASFYAASNDVERDEFGLFTRQARDKRESIIAMEWLPRYPDSGPFSEARFAVEFAEPPNTTVYGLDRSADPEHRRAMERAVNAGEAMATAASPATHDADMVRVLQPIYHNDSAKATVSDRRANLQGFVACTFRVGRLVERALERLEAAAVRVLVRDTEKPPGQDVLYSFDPGGSGDRRSEPDHALLQPIDVRGRSWEIRCSTTTAYMVERRSAMPTAALVVGLLVTGILAGYLWILLGQRERIALLVERRTDELTRANEELVSEVGRREDAEGKLQRSNEDLAQFAYVASHDLQEPLRMIASYCQLLERRYADQIGDTGRKYVEYAVDGAKRMQMLITDLLAYSRINTQASAREPADLNGVVDLAIANLQASVEEHGATVTRDGLPTLPCVAPHMLQLFQNLIGNAIKFHGDEPPRVHVAFTPKDDQPMFRVQDNGIGIDPEHRERVFEVFRRLHGREEFAGTGIGLAVCKKVVGQHGGRIWVESEPGKGTTFCFTLSPTGEPSSSFA